MKHIDIALHFLRAHVEKEILEWKYAPSRDNLVEIFTKALAHPLHEEMIYGLGILPARGGVLRT